jgi:hypothetical protein
MARERWKYWRPKCKQPHYTGSKIGKAHRELAYKGKTARMWKA